MLAKLRYNTTVAKKVLMAVTGLAMVVFLIGHLVGNLQLLWSLDQFNAYAKFLTAQPVVYAIEFGLLAIFLLHIADAIVLLRGNYAARPVAYEKKTWGRTKSPRSKKSWSSTLMMWSGTAILLFVPFHVWHFKYNNPVASPKMAGHDSDVVVGVGGVGVATTEASSAPAKEAYYLANLVVREFQNPFVSLLYIAAMLLLGMHLWHAISSAATSLGLNHPRYSKLLMWVGNILTVIITGGFILLPVLVWVGYIKPL